MSKPRFCRSPHARFQSNRAPLAQVVLNLATLLLSLGAAMTLNAAARLTNSPAADGKFIVSWSSRGTLEMAAQLAGPWLTLSNASNPYSNQSGTDARFFRLNQTVDATTLRKKVMCGYQGWFRCPGDGGSQWIHWSRNSSQITTNTLTFEMWPDMSEYTNKYPAPGFTYPGGAQAYLFSSQDQQTVDRHFDWMQDYGIDGVYGQRFAVGVATEPTNLLNSARNA